MRDPSMTIRWVVLALLIAPGPGRAQGTRADYERSNALRDRVRDKVVGGRVVPNWFDGGRRFWYREHRADGTHAFLVVETEMGAKAPAFDHARLADALAKAVGQPVDPARLPFERIAVTVDGAVRFEALGKAWRWGPGPDALVEDVPLERQDAPPRPPEHRRWSSPRGERSPDGAWSALVQDGDLVLRNTASGDEHPLTTDGNDQDGYEPRVFWAPDSSRFVALRTVKAEEHKVHFIESSPPDQVQPRLRTINYLKPGDRIAVTRPHLFDLATRAEVAIADDLFPTPWSIHDVRWDRNSSRFTFEYNQRGHQVLRIIAVDAGTGAARALVDERQPTFIDYAHKHFVHYLDDSREVLWMSERDGWNHLYLIDADTGAVKNAVTSGEWVVRGVDRVDEAARQVWFQAGGIHPDQGPYHVHFARVNLDGTGLVVLTEGDGTHEVQFAPDRRTLIDTYSRVDLPPITELRRVEDGALIAELERADWSPLLATGWQVPERFVAKGRDDATDIHGVIFRPTTFDPARAYPIIEKIYAGPQGAFVPQAFSEYHDPQALAELGFIVVQIDGMGTNWRSKAFHDVCSKNLADAGFPDRIRWVQAAARRYPYMDASRVGIYGGSAGGQSALGALLFHGDFYKAAAADCGCHDNRMDKIWWNELWMGWPIGGHYAEQSNVTNAHKLQGNLLLMVGELDHNVDPASTMQVINALIRADKDFELIVFPGAGHGAGGGRYGRRRMFDFFVRHLHGTEPRAR